MTLKIKPEQIKEIAECLDAGMACFYNKANGELETYPFDLEYSGLEDEWAEVTGKIEAAPEDYLQIKKMDSREAFGIMERFVNKIQDIPTRNKFLGIIHGKKAFANFKKTLLNYPDLREQWFIFKLDRYIEFIKRQIEVFNTINDPIIGFYVRLEYHLTETFQNSSDKEVALLWCDGVFAVESPISDLSEATTLETQAIIGQLGHSVQEKYQMVIKFGQDSMKKYKLGLSIIDCLPTAESLEWVVIDIKEKRIELQLT